MFRRFAPPQTVIPGRERRRRRRDRTRNPDMGVTVEPDTPGFRVRDRQVPAAPRNDELGSRFRAQCGPLRKAVLAMAWF